MALHVKLFIPRHFVFKRLPSRLLGFFKIHENNIIINCVLSLPYIAECKEFSDPNRKIAAVDELGCQFGKIGAIFSFADNRHEQYVESSCYDPDNVEIVVRVNRKENEIVAERIMYASKPIPKENVYFILYDGNDIKSSELLESELNKRCMFELTAIHFLIKTINFCAERKNLLKLDVVSEELLLSSAVRNPLNIDHRFKKTKIQLVLENILFFILQCFILPFGWFYNFISNWWPHFLTGLLTRTAFGRQAHHRFLQMNSIFIQLQRNKALNVSSKNLIVAIVLDLAFGWFAMYYLQTKTSHQMIFYHVMKFTNDLVNWLQKLIIWLMGAPGGLKLNIPLNSALGHIFLYHIYLWKSYIVIILPIFKLGLAFLPFVGMIGFTFLASLFSDLVAFITIHIYCFYGYASRIYCYQLRCLITLWRLFRGKKWNPENQRVESYTYGVHQLYLGTLLFTVLLFLLPTVMVYYFAFTALRLAVLFIQGILCRLIQMIAQIPIYVVVMRISNSIKIAGGLQFSALKSNDILVLSMEVVQIDLSSVIQHTLPALECYEQPLSWRSFLSSLMWGNIIYPI